MKRMKRVNTTMPESLLRKVDLYGEINLQDRSTAIRQLVAAGLAVKLQASVLEQFQEGRITLRQGAEMLGLTYLEMDDLLHEKGIPLVSDLSLAARRPTTQRRSSRARSTK